MFVEHEQQIIHQVTIIGVGLIGGSLGLALRKANYCKEIVGYNLPESCLHDAIQIGAISRKASSLAESVQGSQLVILSVPVGSTEQVLQKIAPQLSADTLITDVGSTKENVVAAAEKVFGRMPKNFIPSHPIAGREKSGVSASQGNLFENHKVIICPTENSDSMALKQVINLWHAVGAETELLSPEQHDKVLAATSHLPHMLAYSLVNTLAKTEYVEDIFRYAAGGFRDLSRIASSNPVMWRDICMENREAILDTINQFQINLAMLKKLIENGDEESLFNEFAQAKKLRDSFIKE